MFGYRKEFVIWLAIMAVLVTTTTIVRYQYPAQIIIDPPP